MAATSPARSHPANCRGVIRRIRSRSARLYRYTAFVGLSARIIRNFACAWQGQTVVEIEVRNRKTHCRARRRGLRLSPWIRSWWLRSVGLKLTANTVWTPIRGIAHSQWESQENLTGRSKPVRDRTNAAFIDAGFRAAGAVAVLAGRHGHPPILYLAIAAIVLALILAGTWSRYHTRQSTVPVPLRDQR